MFKVKARDGKRKQNWYELANQCCRAMTLRLNKQNKHKINCVNSQLGFEK